MFDLDREIADWRREMLAAGIKNTETLDELESHLRDDVEQQVRLGLSERQAFAAAVRGIGHTTALRYEFEKSGETPERKTMKRTVILAALFGTVLGLGMVLPVLGRWNHSGVLQLAPLLTGVALIIAGGSTAFLGIRGLRGARGKKLINIGIIAAGGVYATPFILAFFQSHETDLMGWIFCFALAVMAVLFFGSCLYFNRSLPHGQPVKADRT